MRTPSVVRAGLEHAAGEAQRLLFGAPRRPRHSRGDAGLFGPESLAWRLHADPSMLVGGLRAVVVQTLHPLVMAGVAQHSDFRRDPWGRLHRTIGFVDTVTYGTAADAEAALSAVCEVHRWVRGVAPDGRPYDAADPALLAWVHAVLVDSALRAYDRYGAGRLDPPGADRYVAEMATIGRRMGAAFVPETVASLRRWLAGVDGLAVGADTRAAAWQVLVGAPVPLLARPSYVVVAAAAVGLLPGWARWRLGLAPVPLLDPVVVRPATRLVLALAGRLLPPSPARAAAETRLGLRPESGPVH